MITRHVSDLVVQLRLEHEVGWHVACPEPRCLRCAEELADEDEAYRRNAHPSLAGSAA
jgi:hypothetical protein